MPHSRRVTIVSHGPNCLDGLSCAVVAARYFAGRRFEPVFSSNREIDDVLRSYDPTHPEEEELWITDISWRDSSTDLHLDSLVKRGLELYWVDHHKSAMDRRDEGHLSVNFTDHVLDDKYAASRLLYEYLCTRMTARGESRPGLRALENLIMLADDVDRWILELDGSRDLALAVRAMEQQDAYRALLSMDSNITYPPDLRAASDRVRGEVAANLEMATATKHTVAVPELGVTVVAAECDGYAGEVAETWRPHHENTVFALYDHRSDGISFRRTPDCEVDLSKLAGMFGGGGHAAAAGCLIPARGSDRSTDIANKVAQAIPKLR